MVPIFFLCSCVHSLSQFIGSYDSKPLVVKTINLHRQKWDLAEITTLPAWQSDWILRRERLEVFDSDLRSSKPDIVLIQEMMERDQNPSESDRNILSAAALAGFDWSAKRIAQYSDSSEFESLGLALAPPLRGQAFEDGDADHWVMGKDGHLAAFLVQTPTEPIAVFNVSMPTDPTEWEPWYQFLNDSVKAFMAKHSLCEKRLIIGGYLPLSPTSPAYQRLLSELKLTDSSNGFCSVESDCYTTTQDNESFMAAEGTKPQVIGQVDRILASEDSKFANVRVEFKASGSPSEYASGLQLTKIYAGRRFGWGASISIPRCL